MNNCPLNWGQIFFINLSWWPTAILLSSWFVARFIWWPMIKKYENVRLPPPPYEDLYPIEEEDKKLVSNKTEREYSFIVENTPSGNIVMKYSVKNEGFEYWADKVISYKYLETVARKYVKTFHCVDLYIDREEMREKKKNQLIAKKKQQEEDKKNKKEEDSLFVSFKSYNKVEGSTVSDRIINNPAAEHANKYIKRGKFNEAFMFKTTKKQSSNKQNLDFSTFKRLFSSP